MILLEVFTIKWLLQTWHSWQLVKHKQTQSALLIALDWMQI